MVLVSRFLIGTLYLSLTLAMASWTVLNLLAASGFSNVFVFGLVIAYCFCIRTLGVKLYVF